MKIRVTLKNPDAMPDAVHEAYKAAPKPDGITDDEWDAICEERARVDVSHISARWMRWGEYLEVEFDTEASTATVILDKDARL